MTTIDEIRAEITELFKESGVSNSSLCFSVLHILDKYAEQEPSEDMTTAYLMGYYENKEPCKDTISREAVIEIINDIRDCISVDGYCAILERLKKLPPARPLEPKTGHWIEHEHNGIVHIECSECSSWFLRAHLVRNSFCPSCGAKMIASQESEDV